MHRGGTQAVCRSFFDGVFDVIRRFLEPVLDYWKVLKLCRFAVLTIALAAFFLIWAPQGREVLIQLQTLEDGWVTKNLWFLASVLIWAWMVWYWSRVIVSFRFPGWPPSEPPERHDRIMFYNRITPRLLGVASIMVTAIAFFSSIDGRSASGPVLGNGGFYVGIAIAFGLVTWKRIPWAARLRARHPRAARFMPDPLPLGGNPRTGALYSGRYDLLPVTRQMLIWSFVLLFILPLFLFQTRPINLRLAPALGAASIILLAAASWIGPGTLLVYLSKWHRLPILTMLVLYAALISTCNDNHAVRTIPADISGRYSKPGLEEQFQRWVDLRVREGAGREYIPMFLVAAEGGGIRAAYWTAAVLTRIQQDQPEFGKHVFLISGVSGGSLGAAVFSGLLAGEGDAAPCAGPTQFRSCSKTLLSHDYLASTLGTMLYPDLLQRFLFWPVMEWDRGRTLEMTWEREWAKIKTDGRNVFEEPFENLWHASSDSRVPNLILNMTSVQSGKRVLLSNLRISKAPQRQCVEAWTGLETSQFDGAIDLSEALNARVCNDPLGVESSPVTVRLSTAVNNSARFAFISPAGTVNERLRIVDGGYFENSGMTTLEEVYWVLRPEVEKRNSDPNQRPKILPIVLYISNEPEVVTLGVRYIGPLSEDIPADAECIRVEAQGSDPGEVGRYQGRCPRAPSFSERDMTLRAERSVREKLKKENYYTIRLDRDNKVVGVVEVHPTHLDEIMAPLEALFRSRDTRGQYAFMHFRRQVSGEQVLGAKFFLFGLRESSANLPLSWTLSTESTKEMDRQLDALFENCRSSGQTLVRYFQTCWSQRR